MSAAKMTRNYSSHRTRRSPSAPPKSSPLGRTCITFSLPNGEGWGGAAKGGFIYCHSLQGVAPKSVILCHTRTCSASDNVILCHTRTCSASDNVILCHTRTCSASDKVILCHTRTC